MIGRATALMIWNRTNETPEQPDPPEEVGTSGSFRRWLAGMISPELRIEAESDPLTGLNNVRTDERMVRKALDDRRKEPGTATVLVRFRADVDNFKVFNDVHGHAAGDRALDLIGRVLRGSVRMGEILVSPARVGGDEFAMTLVIPAEESPDRIRRRLENEVSRALRREGFHRAGDREIGVSVGYAVAGPDTPLRLLDAEADRSARSRKSANGRSRPRPPRGRRA